MSTLRRSSIIATSFAQNHNPDFPDQQTRWSVSLVLTVGIMISSGTMVMIGYKVQGIKYNYNHGLMQTAQMFLGEWMNLLIFFLTFSLQKNSLSSLFSEMKENSRTNKSKMRYSKLWMGTTSFLDSLGSGLSISSLLLIPASVNMMLGGAIIIASTIISFFFFKRKIHRHHTLGCISTFTGFCIVGLSSIMGSKGSTHNGSSSSTILGISMVGLSIFISAFNANLQEYLFRRFEIPPQREIGLEGLFGTIWIFVLLMIFSFIPCMDPGLCTMGGPLDDVVTGTIDMTANFGILFWSIVTILSMGLFNWTNVILVKKVSCLFSGFMGTMPTVTVWFVSLAIGYEKFDPKVSGIQFAGFLFLIFGNFVFNEILEIKLCGLNKKMSKYIGSGNKKKEKEEPTVGSLGQSKKLKSALLHADED